MRMRKYRVKYNVSVDYTDFYFDNPDDAIKFLDLSANSISKEDRGRILLTAVVEFDDIEEDNEDEE